MAVVRFDALRTLAFGGISGTYAVVGGPLTVNWRIFKITNDTNGNLLVSLNGTTDNLFVPANGFVLYDLATNSSPLSVTDNFVMQIGTQFYVKQSTAPTSGAIWIEGIYVRGTQ